MNLMNPGRLFGLAMAAALIYLLIQTLSPVKMINFGGYPLRLGLLVVSPLLAFAVAYEIASRRAAFSIVSAAGLFFLILFILVAGLSMVYHVAG
jgi:hypothetical protein